MKKYKQLTLENRYYISANLKAGNKISFIAQGLGVPASTIKRELDRNSGSKGYDAELAHTKAMYRRKNAKKRKDFTLEIQELAEYYIRLDFSPEQVSDKLKKQHGLLVSHERLYLIFRTPIVNF